MTDVDDVPETWRALRAPKIPHSTAIATYHQALIRDTIRFKNGDDAGREGAARALAHTIELLNKMGIPNPLLEPLGAIAVSMTDLDRGIQPALLQPTTRRGRPPASSNEQIQDGVIAAIAEGFERAAGDNNWSNAIAMSQAARMMNSTGMFPHLSATRVKNIRSKVKADRDSFAKDQFDAITADPAFAADPLTSARRLAAAPLGAGNVNLRK